MQDQDPNQTAESASSATSRYITPTVLATLVSILATFATNWYVENNKALEATRAHKESFTKLLTERILDRTKALSQSGNTGDEQQAAVTLLALDGLAETESEHLTTLLVGARLVNANEKRGDAGGPAARFLDTAIGEIRDKSSVPGHDQAMYERLLTFVKSTSFVDLVTAGFPTEYYSDNPGQDFQPTLYGDQNLGVGAKDRLLALIGPDNLDGWIYVASWKTKHRVQRGSARGVNALAADLKSGNVRMLREPRDQYAIPPVVASAWLRASPPKQIRTLSPRLLRDNPPVTYASATNPILKGTLGRVIGVVPVRTCLQVVDRPRPVIVYVDSFRIDPAARRQTMDAIVHLWVHVKQSDRCPPV